MSTTKFTDFLKEKLKAKDFREGFLAEKAVLASALAVARARENAGLTQRELAEKAKMLQSTIARIESGQNTSVQTMSKIAFALDKSLIITIE